MEKTKYQKQIEAVIKRWLKDKREMGEVADWALLQQEVLLSETEFHRLHETFYYTRNERALQRHTLPGEEWRAIPGFSKYLVSNKGRVWSLGYGDGLMRPQICNDKYYAVVIRDDSGKYVRRRVHRLVASAFIPNPENCETVDHINEDRLDNRAENLRWMTLKQNREAYMSNHGIRYADGSLPTPYPSKSLEPVK